jgi:outer membrane protein assembly factor BamB
VGSPWNHKHPGDGYKGPGAAWNDVFVVGTAGEDLVDDDLSVGYGRLHALNSCATTENDRVRWIRDIPDNGGNLNSLGVPTVTGGIVFIGTDQGHLVILGDPSIAFDEGSRCSNIDYKTPEDCTKAGYSPFVRIPKKLAIVRMPDGGDIAHFRKEAALANGRVFVATGGGHVYMLDTTTAPPPHGGGPSPCGANCEAQLNDCLAGAQDPLGQCLCQNANSGCRRGCGLPAPPLRVCP